MIQKNKKEAKEQFLYIDRWVDKCTFRAFVYGNNNSKQLANSYDEYKKLIDSGEWYTEQKDVPEVQEVPKLVAVNNNKVLKIRKSKNGDPEC